MLYEPTYSDFYNFYEHNLSGQLISKILNKNIDLSWQSQKITNQLIIGIGYSKPYLSLLKKQNLTLSLTTHKKVNDILENNNSLTTILVKEDNLPICSETVNKIILVHIFEYVTSIRSLLQEVNRILVPGGKAIIFVINNYSIVSINHPIFNYAQNINKNKLINIITHLNFTILQKKSVVFSLKNNKLHRVIDNLCSKYFKTCGKFQMIEIEKQLYEPIKTEIKFHNSPSFSVLTNK